MKFPGDIGRKHLDYLFELHGGICALCGCEVSREQASIDHIIPRSRGGRNELGNKQLAHKACNNAKGNKLPFETAERRLKRLIERRRKMATTPNK